MNNIPHNIDAMQPWQRSLKRAGDILAALTGLVLLSPVFLLIAVLLKCERKGGVFFSQERIGKGGRPFQIYKFRTMQQDAEGDGVPLLAQEGDNRLTTLGGYLRAYHLDELPQLWNVLKGDMALVGYRPERQYFIDMIMQHNPDYALLYASRPGVTSKATLYNGYTDTMEKMLVRLDMDLDYLRTRTLRGDLHIIFETVCAMGGGKKF